MAFDVQDLLEGVRASRRHFLKHLRGLRQEQWDWKPYPECKSIRETLAHLIWADRAALESLRTGKAPHYDALEEKERDLSRLQAILDETHDRLCTYLSVHHGRSPLDTEVCLYGGVEKLGTALAHLTDEDFYHAGQVAFIRMATDPGWDYYGLIYSE